MHCCVSSFLFLYSASLTPSRQSLLCVCVSVCECVCVRMWFLNVTTVTFRETYSNITPNFVTLSCSCVGDIRPFLGAVCAHVAPHWQFLVCIGSCVCVFELQCCVPSPCGSQTAAWLEIALITAREPSSQSVPPRRRYLQILMAHQIFMSQHVVHTCVYMYLFANACTFALFSLPAVPQRRLIEATCRSN